MSKKLGTHCNKGHELTPANTYILRKKDRKSKQSRVCRICYLARAKEWSRKNQAKYRKNARQSQLRQRGWDHGEFEEAYIKQQGKCAICGDAKELCADHDHVTMKRRDLLCRACNVGLGGFKDSIVLLQRAIQYLEKWGIAQWPLL